MTTPTILIVGTDMMALYNHRLELIERLISLGYGVTVVAPRGGEEKNLENIGVKFIDTKIDTRGTNPKNDLKLLRELIAIIRRERPGIVLTFYTKTNIYGGIACQITHTPYIENITGLGSAVSRRGPLHKFMKALYKFAIAKASIVFFQNKSNEAFFRSGMTPVKRSRLLPGSGVCLTRFVPLEYPADGKFEFLFISRVLKEKGIEEYINAAKLIQQKYPGTMFHVVGPANEELTSYLKQAEVAGVIKYHGKTFDTTQYIKRTHCTVFPSYYAEGMANVLLESASSARPIITTGRPGCGETVEDGVTGFIVREKDYHDLADKMEKFILMPYEEKREMGLKGREKMVREFNREIVINAYVEEIDKTLSIS